MCTSSVVTAVRSATIYVPDTLSNALEYTNQAKSSDMALPQTHRALTLTSRSSPLEVHAVPTPQPVSGSVVLRVLAVPIISYAGEVYSGAASRSMYSFPLPFVPGTSCIGRVAATGADATSLEKGQLVYFDFTIRGRDDPDAIFLSGLTDGKKPGSVKLMGDMWRDSTFAEYANVPLENCHALEEGVFTVEEYCDLGRLLVPFGGLRDIDLKSGETIVIAPATGPYGSAAVQVALGMGAGKVIAMGRNETSLARLASMSDRVATIKLSGKVESDLAAIQASVKGPVDAFFDISPPEAAGLPHTKAGILSLRRNGRASLMGGMGADLSVPYLHLVFHNIKLQAKWMYERERISSCFLR